MTALDIAAGYRALRESAAAVEIHRDVLLAIGGDAVSFLHGQLSQDIEALSNGESAWSFVLQPDGKVVALVRVTRLGEGAVALDLDGGWGETVKARLERFLLRVDCRIDGPVPGLTAIAVRGPASAGIDVWSQDQLLRAPSGWPGVDGFDVVAREVGVPDDVPEAPIEALHSLRVEAGWPALGHEITDGTIPAELPRAVIDAAVSFTKGCYTGQELVERMDARGSQAPRHLLGLVFPTGPVESMPPPAAEVRVGGEVVGAVTSPAYSPSIGAPVALALVARKVEPLAAVDVQWDDHEVGAEIRSLPLL